MSYPWHILTEVLPVWVSAWELFIQWALVYKGKVLMP